MSVYFKTSEKKTPIDPDKISEEIFLNSLTSCWEIRFAEYPERKVYKRTLLIPKNSFNFFVRFINHIKLFEHLTIFVIFNFVNFSCAQYTIATRGHTRVAMVYQINTRAHAVRVVLGEIQ